MSSLYNAGVYAAASTITVSFVFIWKLSACSLFGLQAYLLPDDSNTNDPANKQQQQQQPKKKKDKFLWNEGGSEILRITIGDSYLENTKFFPEFDQAILYSALGTLLLIAREYLHLQSGCNEEQQSSSDNEKQAFGGDGFIPVVVTAFCILKLLHILCKVSWDKHSSRIELALSFAVGFFGFMLASITIFTLPTEFIDFGLDRGIEQLKLSIAGAFTIRVLVSAGAACLTGVLLGPAIKCVRCFWLGTNQLGWDLPVIQTGSRSKLLLNLSMVLPLITALLWWKPMSDLFIRSTGRRGSVDDWARNFGFSEQTFVDVKFVGLLLSGVIQLLLLRINLQCYLNLAVIAWYESLHGSTSPDRSRLKTKILVVNHFMCRVAVQSLIPAMLLILLAGLSRADQSSSCDRRPQPSLTRFLGQISLFFSWWTLLSWALLTNTVLALFRFGLLLAY